VTIHNLTQWRSSIAIASEPAPDNSIPAGSSMDRDYRIQTIGRLVVPSPEFNEVQEILDLHALSRTPGGDAPCLIQGISGPASVGKSTATMHHARKYEVLRRRQRQLKPITGPQITRDFPNGSTYVPVVRITAQSGPVQTLHAVIRFFGFEPSSSRSASPREQITHLLTMAQTELLYIEQFNAFQGSTAGAAAISEQLKFLSEATDGLALVIVGIDLERETLRANQRSAAILNQLFDRLNIHTMSHPDPFTPQGIEKFLGLLATWEERLPLLNKKPGDLTDYADLIAANSDNARTARLSSLLRTSARLAILDGSEQISPRHITRSSKVTRNAPTVALAATTAARQKTARAKTKEVTS
jgi:hypothetical protein